MRDITVRSGLTDFRLVFRSGLLAGLLAVLCCFLCHCGVKYSREAASTSTEPKTPAEKLLQTFLSSNDGLDTIKGLGRVKITQDGQLSSFRAAWIGRQPNQFRIEALAASGRPAISFSSDGTRFYFLSYSDGRLVRRKASENGLGRIVSIDMGVKDFLDLLSGRFPVQQGGGDVRLQENGDFGAILIVEGGACKCIERVFLNADRTRIVRFERRERGGKLLFRVDFGKIKETEGFQLPESMTITDNNGTEIQIAVERCWVNPELDEDAFVLKAP